MQERSKKLISGKTWYHQRFDGSPMFICFIATAEFQRERRKPPGNVPKVRVCYFSRGNVDWYLDMDDIERGASFMVKIARKDRLISTKLLRAWKKDERACERFFWQEFPKINLKKLSNDRLVKLWQRYWRMFILRFTSSIIIDHFALGTDELIGRMLRREVGGKLKKESEFVEIFSMATAPVRQSFINQAEIDLLKIALRKSKPSLANHQKKYFWTRNNYINWQVLTENDFRKEMSAWKKSGADLRHELKKIQTTPQRNRRSKQKLFKKYKLSPLLRTLLKISEDFTWWQDERKRATYWNTHIGSLLLKEVSQRIGYPMDELKFAVAEEIPQIVKNGLPNRKELRARRAGSIFIFTPRGREIITGAAVKKIRQTMFARQSNDERSDIRGLSASLGRVVGHVKVVGSVTEIGKVQKGDILMAVMTRPDYVPAMKRAAAIVTNEGGITSHAAIVSRELGIPCIIGTKIATQVFKDGDLVEVNANHGWVRKIK